MGQFEYELSILIAGVDSSGGHIYRIDNPGRMEIFDSIGHCSIGSGELHAISTFVANDYNVDLDLNHVVALTYEAKRRSEKAQGVGEKSDFYIISKEGYTKLSEEIMMKLDNIYNRQSKKDENVINEIEKQIESLSLETLAKNRNTQLNQ
jgi:20S proteasome alpha/beta subunit